jgi:signal transduction histidine kinase
VPIRLRLALVVLVASAALVASGVVLFSHQLRSGLVDSIDRALGAEAAPIVSQVAASPGNVDTKYLDRLLTAQPGALAQVLGPSGEVVFSSPGLGGLPILQGCPAKLHCGAPRAEDSSTKVRSYFFVTQAGAGDKKTNVRFLAMSVRRSDGTWVVVVGSSLDDAQEALGSVWQGLLAGGGVAVLLATIGAWVLGGAALRPVERMRKEVAAIGERDPAGSIKVPSTRDELARLAGTMNDLLGRLGKALARERRFVADASHELRTPLAVLQTELELARKPERTREELAEAVSQAADEAERLSRLAEDLLFLARVDEGVPVLRASSQEVAPVIVCSLDAWREAAAARAVSLTAELEPGVTAWFDQDRLRQALDNLVGNSLRFAPSGSSLEVSARRSDGFAVVGVADRGEGFPEEFLPHAFERFSRPDVSRSLHNGGSGLGLAVTAAIARVHGGWVTARNRRDGGASVELALPVQDPSGPPSHRPTM